MIASQDLTSAIKMVNPLFNELQELYGYLPKTQCRCQKPGVCCAYIPQMTLLEALHWIRIIQQMPDTAKTNILKKFMTYYLTNPVHHAGCPFLQNNVCNNYRFRSFACRAYGIWSRRIGDDRTHKNRLERHALLDMWKRLGLNLPPEMVASEIDYCDQVQSISQPAVSDDELVVILEKIYRLDRRLPELQQKFEQEYYSDISFLITSLVLSPRKAVLGKFAVIKELVNQGRSKRLEAMLAKATSAAVAGNSI